jgi:hypothetical protein
MKFIMKVLHLEATPKFLIFIFYYQEQNGGSTTW